MTEFEWKLDEYGYWNIHTADPSGWPVHVWLEPRNSYCDRGHWKASVDGIVGLDAADCFPRYYMRLEVAKQEMADWLRWRLFKQRAEPYSQKPNVIDVLVGDV